MFIPPAHFSILSVIAFAAFALVLRSQFGSWEAGVVWSYIATAASVAILTLAALITHLTLEISAPALSPDKVLRRLSQPRKFLRVLAYTGEWGAMVLQVIWKSLLWPTSIVTTMLPVWRALRRSKQSPWVIGIRQFLFGRDFVPPELAQFRGDIHGSAFALAAAMAIYGVDYSVEQANAYVPLLALLLFVAIVVRHVSYILVPGSLVRTLRLASRQPQTLFLILFLCDLAALALLLPVVAMEIRPAAVSSSDLWEALAGAVPHHDWLAILTGKDLSRRTIIINGAGLAFDVAVIRSLYVGLTTGRTDKDLVALAEELFSKGDLLDAHATLDKLSEESMASSALRARLYLNQANIEEAKEAIKLHLRFAKAPTSIDAIYFSLATFAYLESSPELWKMFLPAAIRDGVSDPLLAIILVNTPCEDGKLINLDLFGGETKVADYVARYSVSLDVVLQHLELKRPDFGERSREIRKLLIIPEAGAARFVHTAVCQIAFNRAALVTQVPQFASHFFSQQLDELERLLTTIMRLEDLVACYGALLVACVQVHRRTPELEERSDRLLSEVGKTVQRFTPSFAAIGGSGLSDLMKAQVDADLQALRKIQNDDDLQRPNIRAQQVSIRKELERIVGTRSVEAIISQLCLLELKRLISSVGLGDGPLEGAQVVEIVEEAQRLFNFDAGVLAEISAATTPEDLAGRLSENVAMPIARVQRECGPAVSRIVLLGAVEDLWNKGILEDQDIWYLISQCLDDPTYGASIPVTPGSLQLAEEVTVALMRLGLPKGELSQADHADRLSGEDGIAKADATLPTKNRERNPRDPSTWGKNPRDPSTWGKIGLNEACPCGSGKKYKFCHGRLS